jgi:hypothetical protein
MAPKCTSRLVKKIFVAKKDARDLVDTDESHEEPYGPGVIVMPDVPSVRDGWVAILGVATFDSGLITRSSTTASVDKEGLGSI